MQHFPKLLPTIRSRLYFLLLSVIIPLFLVMAYIAYQRYQMQRANEFQANLEAARATSETFDAFIWGVIHKEHAIGLDFAVSPPSSGDGMNQLLLMANLKDYSPVVRNFAWVSPQGLILASNMDVEIGSDIADCPSFHEILNGKEWSVSDLIHSQRTGEPVFTVSRGVWDGAGQLLGIVMAVISPERLGRVLKIERAREGALMLIDREGSLVYSTLYADLDWNQRGISRSDPSIRQALESNQETEKVSPCMFTGIEEIRSTTPSRASGWLVVSDRPLGTVMQPLKSQLFNQIVILLLVTVVVFSIAVLISHSISVPVKRLGEQARALGRGELKTAVEIESPVELKELALIFNEMANGIISREQRLRSLSTRLLIAQEEERKRLAGELHDSIGGTLSSLKYALLSVLHDVEQGHPSFRSISNLIEMVQKSMEDSRRIWMDLRPSILDDLGIIPTIAWHTRQFQTIYTNIRLITQIDIDEEDVPESLKIVIYRIVQEALNNAAKYSGADTITVCFGKSHGAIELILQDNGKGFDIESTSSKMTDKGGLGLVSMKERTELSGGTFSIESAVGQGVMIRASWSL